MSIKDKRRAVCIEAARLIAKGWEQSDAMIEAWQTVKQDLDLDLDFAMFDQQESKPKEPLTYSDEVAKLRTKQYFQAKATTAQWAK